jgi:hypothetical protein
MHYNFCRIHKTLKITPAMAAGVTSRLWEMSDIVDVLEAWEAKASDLRRSLEGGLLCRPPLLTTPSIGASAPKTCARSRMRSKTRSLRKRCLGLRTITSASLNEPQNGQAGRHNQTEGTTRRRRHVRGGSLCFMRRFIRGRIMKKIGKCTKCASPDILKIPGLFGSGNNIPVGATIFSSVKVTRYLPRGLRASNIGLDAGGRLPVCYRTGEK